MLKFLLFSFWFSVAFLNNAHARYRPVITDKNFVLTSKRSLNGKDTANYLRLSLLTA